MLYTRQCKLHWKSHCADAAGFHFCRLPHNCLNVAHLDPHHRRTFRKLCYHSRAELLMPIVKKTVEELNLGQSAVLAFDAWWQEIELVLRDSPGGTTLAHRNGIRRLERFLQPLSLFELASTLPDSEWPKEALLRLVETLRATVVCRAAEGRDASSSAASP